MFHKNPGKGCRRTIKNCHWQRKSFHGIRFGRDHTANVHDPPPKSRHGKLESREGTADGSQTLSWLTGSSATPVDLSNPFGIGTSGSSSFNYEAASTALTVGGIGQFGAEFGSGTASIGSNFKFYSGGFYGNQYVSVTMVSDIAHFAGYPLAGFSTYMDYQQMQNGQMSPWQFGANTTATGVGVFGGPVGASFSVGYGAGTLIQQGAS